MDFNATESKKKKEAREENMEIYCHTRIGCKLQDEYNMVIVTAHRFDYHKYSNLILECKIQKKIYTFFIWLLFIRAFVLLKWFFFIAVRRWNFAKK